MFRFKSLTAKFIFISAIMLAFLCIYLAVEYTFTRHIDGEGRRINLAGKERMLIFDMSFHIFSILQDPPRIDRESHMKHIEGEMSEYEEVLYGLRDGNKRLMLKPIPEDNKESISHINKLIELWKNSYKPTAIYSMNLPPDKKEESCKAGCHSSFHENLKNLEDLAKSLESYHDKEIKDFDTFRSYAIGFFFIAAAFVVLYTRRRIITPAHKLIRAAKDIEKGNFDVSIDIKGMDDICQLADSFNKMANNIKVLFEEKAKHLQELKMLAQSIENSGVLVVITDREGKITYVNSESARRLVI